MNRWRGLSYSISVSLVVSALASLFLDSVLGLLAVPGMMSEGWANILILLSSEEQYPYQFSRWQGFSFLFYAILIYSSLRIYALIRLAGEAGKIK